MFIGAHASISPSILAGIQYIHSIGGNIVQIFSGPSQTTGLKAKQTVSPEDAEHIREFLSRNNMKLVIHAIYSLNFCAYPATSGRIKYAHTNVIYDMELAQRIGASGVVLHLGSRGNLSEEIARDNMVSNINHILSETRKSCPDVFLALETPAGQGTQIASNLEGLFDLFWKTGGRGRRLVSDSRLGICVDTAHIFSAGLDIRQTMILMEQLFDYEMEFGKGIIKLFHLNDSAMGLGSRRDVHAGLTTGHIFSQTTSRPYLRVLYDLLKYARTHKIPVILETHKAGSLSNPDGELYAEELAMLKDLSRARWPLKVGLASWKLLRPVLTNIKTKKAGQRNIKQKQIALANIGLIKKFKGLQDYYLTVGKDKFRALAYGKAVLALQSYPEEIVQANQVAHLPGIGPQILKKVAEYLDTGDMNIYKSENIAARMAEYAQAGHLAQVLGFGPVRVRHLARQGIYTLRQLEERMVSDTGIKLSPVEELGVRYHSDLSKKIPRQEAEELHKKLVKVLKPLGLTCELAGSYPSGKAESKDIDILIFSDSGKMSDIRAAMSTSGLLIATVSAGSSSMLGLVRLSEQYPVRHMDIRLLPTDAELYGRFYFTSGRDFNQLVRAHAKQQGYKLNERGLFDMRKNGTKVKGLTTESELMEYIGLAFIPMEKRR